MLSRLSIKQKLNLIMLVPLVVIVLLAVKLTLDSYGISKNLNSLDKVVVLSTKIGALVHESQVERGMTSSFIETKGEQFKTELPSQRLNVDEKLKEFNTFLSSFDKTGYSLEFTQNLDSAIKKLEELGSIRSGVNSFSIKGFIAIEYYTELNKLLNFRT